MNKNSKIISLLLLIAMIMIVIPSSFAATPEDNSTESLAVNDFDEVNEIDFSGEIKEASSKSNVGSGVDVTDGISVVADNINYTEGSDYKLKGTLYYTGAMAGETYYYGGESAILTYTYTGSDGNEYTKVFTANSWDATFEIDLSKLPALTTRNTPYTLTISCDDENYEYMCDALPDPVDITITVIKSGGDEPAANPALYVAANGSDSNNGSVNAPFASIEKAVTTATSAGKEYDIFVNEGSYDITKAIKAENVNIIGLTNKVIFDMKGLTYAFDASLKFSVTNVTFVNGRGTGYGNAGAIKSTSTGGRSVDVINCKFINCSAAGQGGAITTHYSGYAKLSVVNSTFINCSAGTYGGAIAVSIASSANITASSFINCSAKNGGAIYFGNTNGKSNVNYCVFTNNTATADNDIQSAGSVNADYNYWGSSLKPASVSTKVTVDKWVVLTAAMNSTNIAEGDKVLFTYDLTKDNTGATIENKLPQVSINTNAKLGSFDNTQLTTKDGKASNIYTADNAGNEVITINSDSVTFDVRTTGAIYVATTGSDTTGTGSITNPYKTLKKALSQVTANRNEIYIFNGTYTETDLEITTSVNIVGESRDGVVFDADKKGRIFTIDTDDINVNIKSLTLTNAKPDYDSDDFIIAGKGGAIYLGSGKLVLDNINVYNSLSAAGAVANCGGASGFLSVVNSTFKGNALDDDVYSSSYDIIGGGAIYNDGKLTINNSTFIDNSAKSDNGENKGGAIYLKDSATITDSTFTNNNAEEGGAIGIDAFNSAAITISKSKFSLNNAKNGGAIYSAMSKLTTIANNEFDKNKASASGGAIYAYGLKTVDNIEGNIFTNNTAAAGGVLYVRYANVTLSGNTMKDNKANEIFYNSGNIFNTRLTYDSFIVNNGDKVTLSARLCDDSGNPITNGNVTFALNGTAVGSGISDDKGIATFTYTTNNTLATYTISGGFNGDAKTEITSGILEVSKYCWFISNKGYFTLQDAVDGSLEGDVITGLAGHYYYKEINIGSRMDKIYKNVTIKADKLGDIVLTGVDGRLFNVAGKHAYAPEHRDSSLTLVNIVVRDCEDDYGAGVYNDGYLTVINCYFANNTATNTNYGSKFQGGAIMGWGGLEVYNSTFEDNFAPAGGAIFTEVLNDNGQFVLIKNSTFINNVAGASEGNGAEGGAIYLSGYGDSYDIVNCTFINNTATAGGAIFAYANLTVEKSVFLNNSALNSGGTIYSTKKDLTLNNIYVENSTAKYGGALYLLQNAGAWITDGVREEWQDVFTINNSTFVNTRAWFDKNYEMSGQGGVIFTGYNTLPKGFINNCTFINSTAEDKGGVLINYIGNVTVTASKFINSSANNTGGAIYNEGYYSEAYFENIYGDMTVEGCIFENTKANHGGAIYNSQIANMNLTNSKFKDITAEGIGGAIYNRGFLNLTKNTMENVAAETGSHIYNIGGIKTAFITFLDNKTVSVNFPGSVEITATVTDDMGNPVTGKEVKVTVDGKVNATLKVVDGKASYNFTLPALGNYTVSGYYSGADEGDYEVKTGTIKTTTLIESKFIAENATILLGEDYFVRLVDINGNPLAKMNVTITVGNDTMVIPTGNDGTIDLSPLKTGTFNISGVFEGDDKYAPSSFKTTLTVEINKEVYLKAYDIKMIYKDGTRFAATLFDCIGNPIANETLIFNINGVNYTKITDENGTASIAVNLVPGIYNVSVSYRGSEKYNSISKDINITIKSTIFADDIVKMYQNETQFYANFTDSTGKALANTNVTFNINGVFYNRTTDENGRAKLNINLRPGEYILTAINSANGEQKGFNVVVKSLIEANELTKYYRNASAFKATIYNKDGSLAVNKTVTFNINGVFYNRNTDDKGVVSLAINLRPGNYIITTLFEGLAIGNNITVLPTLVTDDLEMSYRDGSKFNATVLDGRGNPLINQKVTFNVNGVFYSKITDINGVASLNINLMKGEYIITSYWNNYEVGNRILIK